MTEIDVTTRQPEQDATRREAGQALVEYALILAFVSITALALSPLGGWLAVALTGAAAAL